AAYVAYLTSHKEEVFNLYRDVFSGATGFFGNPETFAFLQKHVFPKFIKRCTSEEPLRVWVPHCATGQEAYSFAIAFHELAGRRTSDIPIQIFATDPSTQAVVRARTGIYSPDIAHEVSPHRLRRFFVKSDDRYQICRPIRDLCIFARQNLMTDSPFSRMDIV